MDINSPCHRTVPCRYEAKLIVDARTKFFSSQGQSTASVNTVSLAWQHGGLEGQPPVIPPSSGLASDQILAWVAVPGLYAAPQPAAASMCGTRRSLVLAAPSAVLMLAAVQPAHQGPSRVPHLHIKLSPKPRSAALLASAPFPAKGARLLCSRLLARKSLMTKYI